MTESTPVELLSDEEQFFEELFIAAGFDPEEDDFELLKADLEPLLIQRVMLSVYGALPTDEDRANFDVFMEATDSWSEQKFMDFVQAKIPNFDDFMANIYLEFQNEYLEAMKEE